MKYKIGDMFLCLNKYGLINENEIFVISDIRISKYVAEYVLYTIVLLSNFPNGYEINEESLNKETAYKYLGYSKYWGIFL